MLVALAAGVVVAFAHHLTNAHLNGKPVDETKLPQAWISRIGTALAFLVKLAFAVSVGVAFTRQWLRFHHQSFKLREVDAVTSILGNAFSFFDGTV